MDRVKRYNMLVKDIRDSLATKIGYPSSLMSNLYGEFRDHDCLVSNGNSTPKLIDNEILGIKLGSFAEVFINNVGDPWQDSKSTDSHEIKIIEREVIEILGKCFGLAKEHTRGYVTSGGTESNMAAIWWAKLKLMNKSTISPIVIATKNSSHYSINKICNIMGLELHLVDADETGAMNTWKLDENVKTILKRNNKSNIIIVATVGSTVTGSHDNIVSMRDILRQCKNHYSDLNYVIHIDGALNGLAMPITKPFGNINNYFDDLDVATIAISGHKLLGVMVCGTIITTKSFLNEAFPYKQNVSYCGDINDITISGSRLGLSSVILHNTLYSLGLQDNLAKLQKIINTNLKNAQYFYTKLVRLLGKDKVMWLPKQFNIIFLKPPEHIMKKYQLMPYSDDKCVACVLINVTLELIDRFIDDYSQSRLR